MRNSEAEFSEFVVEVEPRLLRALVALRGAEAGRDATAEALLWAWANWEKVRSMANPAGYLYRVGRSRSRLRRPVPLASEPVASPPAEHSDLVAALRRLTHHQRAAVMLVCGCSWTYDEVATALGISKSSVGTHLRRGLERLRQELEPE